MQQPPLMKSAKKKVEKKQAQICGTAWRAEVLTCYDSDNGAHWKPFDDWKDQYEPKKQESERKKKIKANVAVKAKSTLLSKLSSGISEKLLVILLEVSSKLLTLAEIEALELSNDATSKSIVPTVLNTVNGIILTYRFDTSKESKKFTYLRRVATDMLTDIMQKAAETAEDTAQTIFEMQSEISKLVKSKQSEARMLASTMLDELIVTANDKIDETVETELENVEGKITEMQIAADAALGASGKPDSDVISMNVSETKVAIKKEKDKAAAQFGLFLKQLLLGEMDRLVVALTFGMDRVFEEFSEVFSRTVKFKNEKETGLEEGLRNDIYDIVDGIYKQTQEKISEQVQQVVDMLGAFMDNKESEEREKSVSED